MSVQVDWAVIGQPLSNGESCGPDLSIDDHQFRQFENASRTIPERQIGDRIEPAVEPDWEAVVREAHALFGRTKDLRVAAILARGLLATQGFAGFAQALTFAGDLLAGQWEAVHPRLDQEAGDMLRAAAFEQLNDREGCLEQLRHVPLVVSSRAGRFTWRHVQLARSEISPRAEEERPSLELIAAAFEEVGAAEPLVALREAIAALEGVLAVYTDHPEVETQPDLDPILDLLRQMERFVAAQLPAEAPVVGNGADQAAEAEPAAIVATNGGGAGAAPLAVGQIRTRSDVKRALNEVCRWYETAEPSSPVPMLLRKALGLMDRDFADIVRELAPSGYSELEVYKQSPNDGG